MKQGSGMRVADHAAAVFYLMEYYADYMNEAVYAFDSNGDGHVKFYEDFMSNRLLTRPIHKDVRPWMWEENGVGDYVEEMTAEEYDAFGKKWRWANAPNENEKKSHSWRNYMRML